MYVKAENFQPSYYLLMDKIQPAYKRHEDTRILESRPMKDFEIGMLSDVMR